MPRNYENMEGKTLLPVLISEANKVLSKMSRESLDIYLISQRSYRYKIFIGYIESVSTLETVEKSTK